MKQSLNNHDSGLESEDSIRASHQQSVLVSAPASAPNSAAPRVTRPRKKTPTSVLSTFLKARDVLGTKVDSRSTTVKEKPCSGIEAATKFSAPTYPRPGLKRKTPPAPENAAVKPKANAVSSVLSKVGIKMLAITRKNSYRYSGSKPIQSKPKSATNPQLKASPYSDKNPRAPMDTKRPFSVQLTSVKPPNQGNSLMRPRTVPSHMNGHHKIAMTPALPPLKRNTDFTMDDFNLVAVLGRGHFGKVLLAEIREEGILCALKSIPKKDLAIKDEIGCVISEKKVLHAATKNKNAFLVRYFGCFSNQEYVFFVMEFLPGGDLLNHLPRGGFKEKDAIFYASCVVLGLEFLHFQRIVYRDLKMENILMGSDGYTKLSDFGLSKHNVGYGTKTSTLCGTMEFLAPEVFTDKAYTKAVDWWALGVLLFELLIGQSPFGSCTEKDISQRIVNGTIEYPKCLSQEAVATMKKLLRKKPTTRLGYHSTDAAEVKTSPFFRKMNWEKLQSRQIEPPLVPKLTHGRDTTHFEEKFTAQIPKLSTISQSSMTQAEEDCFKEFDCVFDLDSG